ncbi:hypothetical protein PBI_KEZIACHARLES14_91 [Mycobacterium phage Keziacharles14]|nr:hypothetical protein PBI_KEZIACHARLES14_91 [Mycobacterium phage Keziacharles14]
MYDDDDYGNYERSFLIELNSGAELYVNRAGRCEDAPCCGCCS